MGIKDLYTENYNTLMKDTKKETNGKTSCVHEFALFFKCLLKGLQNVNIHFYLNVVYLQLVLYHIPYYVRPSHRMLHIPHHSPLRYSYHAPYPTL